MTIHLNHEEIQLLYRYCFALTNHSPDAYDLLQNALEKWVVKARQQTVGVGYLRRIIRNQFIDDCRAKHKVVFAPYEEGAILLASASSLDKILIDRDDIERLLQHFNEGERETLFLSAVMGYSAREIAEQTDESRNTILSRLHRIKQKAAATLQNDNDLRQGQN